MENETSHSSIRSTWAFCLGIRHLNQAVRLQPKMKHGGELPMVLRKLGRVNQPTNSQVKDVS